MNRYALVLCLLAISLFFPGLGARDFWAPAEPIRAEVVRVMFERGEWIVPTVNGHLYPDKPILYFWLALLFSKLTGGVSEWTVRLPAALGGLGLVLVTFQLGRSLFGPETGFIAAIILATTSRVLWDSTFARVDTLLGFFLLLGYHFSLKAFLGKGPRGYYLLAYLCFGLATLTKGLVGFVLPGLALFCLIALTGRWREIKEMRLIPGFVLFVLVVAPWPLLLYLNGQSRWLVEFIGIHHFQRYAGEPLGHVRPFYYYLLMLPVDFLPWTIFLPGAILYCYPWRERLREPGVRALLCWFAVVFVFFTISKSKIAYYLLPLLPSLALFVAIYIQKLREGGANRESHWLWTKSLAFVLAALMLLGGIAMPIGSRLVEPALFFRSLPLAFTFVAGAVGLLVMLRRGNILAFFWALSATLSISYILISLLVYPYVDNYKSPRPLAEFILHNISPQEPVYIFKSTMDDFNYYSKRDLIRVITSVEEAQELKSGFILVRERDLRKIDPEKSRKIVAEGQPGEKKWYLIALGEKIAG